LIASHAHLVKIRFDGSGARGADASALALQMFESPYRIAALNEVETIVKAQLVTLQKRQRELAKQLDV
jgi:hypothetical protein